mgnify:CR=1 FL=1
MKSYKILFAGILLGFTAVLGGCNALDREPHIITEDQFYTSSEQAQLGLNAVYGVMNSWQLYGCEEGLVVPTSIVFHKEKKYDIESVTASIRAAATKVLGSGTRYTVVIKGQEKYLFEEVGRWFVEAVIPA